MSAPYRPLADRFFEKVGDPDPVTGCREWLASKHRNGYGQFSTGNKKLLAHRAAWFVEHGEWPEGVVMHACDNPACVNISHLSLGTRKDNHQDAARKGRLAHRLTTEQVAEIKRRYRAGGVTMKQLAEDYGVWYNTIYGMFSGRSWTHIE